MPIIPLPSLPITHQRKLLNKRYRTSNMSQDLWKNSNLKTEGLSEEEYREELKEILGKIDLVTGKLKRDLQDKTRENPAYVI
jgi:hypothetical protein